MVADVGGTHVRLARASVRAGTFTIEDCVTFQTGAHADFAAVWNAFAAQAKGPLPTAAAIAAAGPLREGRIALTNAPWVIEDADLRGRLGLRQITLLNDFAAVAHAAADAPPALLAHLAGPGRPLPANGTITVIGPGTGLGVAAFHRDARGVIIQAGEGGHLGFAPQDAFEDRLLARLRRTHRRVVSEHVVAGPGLAAIHAELGGNADATHAALWDAALSGHDDIAAAALAHFCAALGAAVGDYALVHGADGVVLAGGLANRLRDHLPRSEFGARFADKPHYEAMMATIPVKLLTHSQPGLWGAAAAFVAEHGAPA